MKRKRATQDQIGRIVAMLVSRQIDFDEAQSIIRKHGKKDMAPTPKGRVASPEPCDEADSRAPEDASSPAPKVVLDLAFWEKNFFGKGAALMEAIGPVCDWNPELKPALPDLEKRARGAVFWKGFKEIRCIPSSQGDDYLHPVSESFEESLKVPIKPPAPDTYDETLKKITWSLACDLLRDLEHGFVDSVRSSMVFSLRVICLYACKFAIANQPEETAKFKPLLELWLAGNFPIGFDWNGNLLVLVAD